MRNRNHLKKKPNHCIIKCKVNSCCDKPAPMSYHVLANQRGECVADMDTETQWWFECYNCGYICTCEV